MSNINFPTTATPTHYLTRDLTDPRTGRDLFREGQPVRVEGRPAGLVHACTPEGCRFVVHARDLTTVPPPAVVLQEKESRGDIPIGARMRVKGTRHTGVVSIKVGRVYYYNHDATGGMFFCPEEDAEEINTGESHNPTTP